MSLGKVMVEKTLENIPLEVVSEIFTQCDGTSLSRLCATSKRLRDIIHVYLPHKYYGALCTEHLPFRRFDARYVPKQPKEWVNECSKLFDCLNGLNKPIPFCFDEYVSIWTTSKLLIQSHEELAETPDKYEVSVADVVPETPQEVEDNESGQEDDEGSMSSDDNDTTQPEPRRLYTDPHKRLHFVHHEWLPQNSTPLNDSVPCRQKSWYTGGPPYTIGGRMEWIDSDGDILKHYGLDLRTGEASIEKQWDFRKFTELFVHPRDRPIMISPEGDIVAEVLYNGAYLVNFTKGWYYYFLEGVLHRVRGHVRQSSRAPIAEGLIDTHGTNGLHVWPLSDRFLFIKLEGGSMWCVHLVDWETGLWHFMMESEDTRVVILYPSYSGIIYVHGRNDYVVGLMPKFSADYTNLTWYEVSRNYGMQNTQSYYSLLFDFNYVPDTLTGRFAWGLDRIVDFESVTAEVAQGDSYAMVLNNEDGKVYCYVFLYHFTRSAIKFIREDLAEADGSITLDINRIFHEPVQ
ncbi:hypothetical protein B0I72DRAFT_139955 [Yarrowia lipolytica]|jgi:hypothetical protein|uniref:YALI0C00275p n=2 Tax=Yarrowia lipolytica TaxID=4952 RepID=Q6CDI4_YARLI|nr:YALI0C00275p [Yarrowia lipolytica CLIB122]AOW02136.1 hypothetical protein YALI1_C00331g [Yarrowia lipolytica]KAB8280999.1 hypothetical protein BKA91DRAFT_140899 [Yarrowia lipolytica]KAE8170290.1 hypothetical protein BKA90DRAFT_141137 [Yarrowia lipolytica]KAJ8052898.1 hypothetical protein LXG23DRAFT_22819 [Yarrowia lipolytica]QNP97554.1 Hypothetical protein YALI2_C01207g [Yarrowia lipolytica]|eukprot:XP_501278.1 YALI0C00275p [Yarrowia lipolytica CLIB122]